MRYWSVMHQLLFNMNWLPLPLPFSVSLGY